MNIYIPYTYLIGWSKHNKFYYGRRTAKNCHPDEFWIKYFTSSKEVKQFRIDNGEPDIIKIRKTFPNNPNSCKLWESRFLKKIDAQHNLKFLNKRNSDHKWDTTGISPSKESKEKRQKKILKYWSNIPLQEKERIQNKRTETMILRYGVMYYLQHQEFSIKTKLTNLKNYGVEYNLQVPEIREKGKQTCLERYGADNPQKCPIIKEKTKTTNLEKYGYEYIFQIPEIKENCLEKIKKKYNVTNENIINVFQIEEIKQKSKETLIIRYGVEHQSKREKQCSFCGEIKNVQHEATCPKNPNRKMPNVSGENNGRAKTFIVNSPENIEYEVKMMKGIREFCKENSLKIDPFIKNKISGWTVSVKEKG